MKSMNLPRRARGVTLIELMTVVGVVGILAAIAVPAYSSYVVRVNRTDAKRDLLDFAQKLERCFTRGNDYTQTERDSGDPCVTLPWTNEEGTYTVTGDIDQLEYTLLATPINGQARDTKCGAFRLTQAGRHEITGTADARRCWEGRD